MCIYIYTYIHTYIYIYISHIVQPCVQPFPGGASLESGQDRHPERPQSQLGAATRVARKRAWWKHDLKVEKRGEYFFWVWLVVWNMNSIFPCGCVWKWLVPLNPMVLLIIIPIKWLFHWEYYPTFSDKPMSYMGCHHPNLLSLHYFSGWMVGWNHQPVSESKSWFFRMTLKYIEDLEAMEVGTCKIPSFRAENSGVKMLESTSKGSFLWCNQGKKITIRYSKCNTSTCYCSR